jgi:hypothetical protein
LDREKLEKLLEHAPADIQLGIIPFSKEVFGLDKYFYTDDDVFIIRSLDEVYRNSDHATLKARMIKKMAHTWSSQVVPIPGLEEVEDYLAEAATMCGNYIIRADQQLVDECIQAYQKILDTPEIYDLILSNNSRSTFINMHIISRLFHKHCKRHNYTNTPLRDKIVRVDVRSGKHEEKLNKSRMMTPKHVVHFASSMKHAMMRVYRSIINNSEKYLKSYIDFSIVVKTDKENT